MKMKKLLSVITVLAMVVCMLPCTVSVYAEYPDEITFSSGSPEGDLEADGYSWDGQVLTMKNADVSAIFILPSDSTVRLSGENRLSGGIMASTNENGEVLITSASENGRASLTIEGSISASSGSRLTLKIENIDYTGGISNGCVGPFEDTLTIKNASVTTTDLFWAPNAGIALENGTLTVDSYFWSEKLVMDDDSVINMNTQLMNYANAGSPEDALENIKRYLPVGYDIGNPDSVGMNTIIDSEEVPATGIVLKKPVTVTVPEQAQPLTYSGQEQTYPIEETEEYTVESTPQTEVNGGGADVVISLKKGTNIIWDNGTREDVNHRFIIAPAQALVKAKDVTIKVGEEAPDLSNPQEDTHYTKEGFFGSDTVGSLITMKYQKDGLDVTVDSASTGTYDIIIEIENPNPNYDIDIEHGTLKIKKASSPQGGGGRSTRYLVEFNSMGGIEVPPQRVSSNRTVSEPEAPVKDGFSFDGWYTDEETKNKYDFESPVKDSFTLYAKWNSDGNSSKSDVAKEDTEENIEDDPSDGHYCPSRAFDDLDVKAWYHLDTDYVIGNKLMNGIGEATFAPNANLTRAMLVTVLYRAEGEPSTNRSIPFKDVDMGAYYANAVIWGQQHGIIKGYSETEFAPDQNITREQIAAMLHLYAQYKGMNAVTLEENLHFDDADEISEYAVSAMNWAVGTGLIKGRTTSTLNPKNNATRAEIAALLHRFIKANK